jgi:alkanesulfonate monooxygenase SsuD/methylene tetrahydromethanopterin reductase-like flavin-dependent oxidoreductase (luciferase family)
MDRQERIQLFTAFETKPLAELRETVRRLEEAGLDGVFVSDHLFARTQGKRSRTEAAAFGFEPLTYLATIGAYSDRLTIGTTVMNCAWIHPAHLLRSFAQLASLFGGDRVLAGLGAGWHREEFEALALPMPPLSERMQALETACALARRLYDDRTATIPGVADDLPLSPPVDVPPRVLLGGGSERLLDLAGRYADVLDLRAPPKLAPGVTYPPYLGLIATVEDAEASVQRMAEAAKEVGRPRPILSVEIEWLRFCRMSEVADVEADVCRRYGIEERDLRRSPFVLIGDAARMRDLLAERRERLGIDLLTVPETVVERVRAEVLL